MLETLTISNYAIIDQLRLELTAGLTAITGETGAGKSILLGALKLALGERAASEALRQGASRALVEAEFGELDGGTCTWLDENGLLDDDQPSRAILRRELTAGGNSRSFINGRAVPLNQLREVGERLVDIHAQNEHTTLFSPGTQLSLLDSFGGHEDVLPQYRAAYKALTDVERRLVALSTDRAETERRKDFLRFQVEEIAKAALAEGEEETLEAERRRLVNAERLGAACATAADLLYEGERTENPAGSLIAAAAKALEEVAALDPAQEDLLARAGELRFAAEDLAARIRDYMATVSVDPERLAFVEERLHLIRALKRKYGASIAEILAMHDSLHSEYLSLQNRDEELARATEERVVAAHAALAAAAVLTARRRKAAQKFDRMVQAEMRELELQKAVFEVRVDPGPADAQRQGDGGPGETAVLGPDGADHVEFLVSTNPGEPPRPLRKVASGGEIARIMLAIKSVLSGRDGIPTLVFDEIDVGISGEAATRVGEKLSTLARSHQVLCITHLPQIAARGDSHLEVQKQVSQGRTRTAVRSIGECDRAEAVARMLSGRDVDKESLRFAQKLLDRGR